MRLPLMSLLLPALVLPAQAPLDTERTPSPYLRVEGGDPAVDGIPLKATRAQVTIAGVIAEVRLTQTYRNEGNRPLEAVYVFPGSTRAAVHALTLRVGDRVIEAQIQERAQARATYEAARSQGRTASLLEQERPNVMQMAVANIRPGDEVQVELTYTELLVPREGRYQFVFPTVVGPRYTGEGGAGNWVANPHTSQGVAPLSTFDLDLRLASGLPIQAMSCGTHATRITYENDRTAHVRLEPSERRGGNRDFILDYMLSGGRIETGLLLSRGEKEQFFLLMMQPPKRIQPQDLPPREYVFVMDVSGSMSGYPLEISKKLMGQLVTKLRPQDRFNVVLFEAGSKVWAPEGSRPATRANLEAALAFVATPQGGGGTQLLSALQTALALPRTEGFARTFAVATDGYVSADRHVLDFLRSHLGDANMFAFGIGTSVNRHLIEGMAHAGQGEAFVAERPDAAEALAKRFETYISGPVLSRIRVSAEGFDVSEVEPAQVPDVLAERPVILCGKWKGEPKGTLRVEGISGSGTYTQVFDVSASRPDPSLGALAYLWARQRIQLLGDYGRLGDASAARQILDLGLTYHLLTDQTSFVAVDRQGPTTDGPLVTVRQPLPMPAGVTNRAVGNYATASVTSSVPIRGAQSAACTVEVVASVNGCDLACAAAQEAGGGISLAQPAARTHRRKATPPAAGTSVGQAASTNRATAQVAKVDASNNGLPKHGLPKHGLPKHGQPKSGPATSTPSTPPVPGRLQPHFGTWQADQRGVDLQPLRTRLEALLREGEVPATAACTLRIEVDAQGIVRSLACAGAPRLEEGLRQRLVGIRLAGWKASGRTIVLVPVAWRS